MTDEELEMWAAVYATEKRGGGYDRRMVDLLLTRFYQLEREYENINLD